MERCDSTTDLMKFDELENVLQEMKNPASDSEELSSGYDSTDSELETRKTSTSCTQKPETTKYRSMMTVCNSLEYILSLPELCDVKFYVSGSDSPIYGVKAIIGCRSKFLYTKILEAQRGSEECRLSKRKKSKSLRQNHLSININGYTAETFRKIIRFIHCGTIDIKESNAVGIYCGAVQFGLEDLKIACWDFFKRCIKENSSLRIENQFCEHSCIVLKLKMKIEDFRRKHLIR